MVTAVQLLIVTGVIGMGILLLPSTHAHDNIVMHFDDECTCCRRYAGVLAERYVVEMDTSRPLASVQDEAGVPPQMRSCHTTYVEGYVIEGHVPSHLIDRLVEERPDIRGLAVPGMPAGSPGIAGQRESRIFVYALKHDGSIEVFA